MDLPTQPENEAPLVFLLFGPTRAGKSTFINMLVQEEVVRVGAFNDDQSTTIFCESIPVANPLLFGRRNCIFIDVVGLNDTKLTKTNEEIVEMIRNYLAQILLQNGVSHLSGILVFESLQNSPIQVGHCLTYLQSTLDGPETSMLVMMTKEDILQLMMQMNMTQQEYAMVAQSPEGIRYHQHPKNLVALRSGNVKLFCDQKGIKTMFWRNFDGITFLDGQRAPVPLSPELYEAQMQELQMALSQLTPYDLSGIAKALQDIEAEALAMYETQEWREETRQIQVEQDELEEFFENVERVHYAPVSGASKTEAELQSRAVEIQQIVGQVQGTELVTVRVPKHVVKHDVVERQVTDYYEKRCGGLSGLFGNTKTCSYTYTVKDIITRTEIEEEEKRILQPIMKLLDLSECLNMARQETTYKRETRTESERKHRKISVPKTITVVIPVPTFSLIECHRRVTEAKLAKLRDENSFQHIFRNQRPNGP